MKFKSFNLLVYYIFDRFIQSSSSYSASSDSDEEDETLKAIRVSIVLNLDNYFTRKLCGRTLVSTFILGIIALFVTSKIEFSNCPILEFKVLQNAFRIKKSQA